MKVTPERLAADLLAEFTVTHNAGGQICTAEYLARFITMCTDAATKRQERRVIALMAAVTRAVEVKNKREADKILLSIQASIQTHALQDP